MFGTKGRTKSKRQHTKSEVAEPDTRMVFAVLAVGVIIGALLMPGKSPASVKAKSPTPVNAAAGK